VSARCTVCGNPKRSGTGGRVLYVDAAGQTRTVIACAKCMARSLVLVTAPPALERTIESDDSDVHKVLRGLARHLRNLAKVPRSVDVGDDPPLWRDGMVQAADFADAWATERAARKPDESIVMAGWVCKTCRAWNSDEKERRETCRVCSGARFVESDVSHIPQCKARFEVGGSVAPFRCEKPIHHAADGHFQGSVTWSDDEAS
jgi:hypothetical protein